MSSFSVGASLKFDHSTLNELVAVNIHTHLNFFILFFSSYYEEETKDIFLCL